MSTIERRLKKRLPLRGFLSCDSTFTYKNQHHIDFELISLSASGMFIVQKNEDGFDIQEGDNCDHISISLDPFKDDRFKGKIQRVLNLSDVSAGKKGFGLEFLDLDREMEEKLDAYVDLQLKFFGLE